MKISDFMPTAAEVAAIREEERLKRQARMLESLRKKLAKLGLT